MSTTRKASRGPAWLRGLGVQQRVVSALMIRIALARFGHENLGFFWTVAEPLALTCGIMVVWTVLGVTHGGEIGVVPFALSGYTYISLWRHIVSRSIRVMRSSTVIAYHRQVKYIDVILATAFLELFSIFAAFTVGFVPLYVLGLCPMIEDPLPLVGGYVLIAWFAFGVGLILASVSELNEVVEHLIAPLMYLTLPLTGVFAMVDWLPLSFQAILVWSPLVNAIEMIRSGLFPREIHTHYSLSYMVVCCCVTTALGLMVYRHAEKRVTP